MENVKNTYADFMMDAFEESQVIEKTVTIGGKPKKMKFKAIPAGKGDEIRKKNRKPKITNGVKIFESDQEGFGADLIIETTVFPDLKNAELQEGWGVRGARELLAAMKTRMTDGEYSEWSRVVSEINGYDKAMNDLIDEAKN